MLVTTEPLQQPISPPNPDLLSAKDLITETHLFRFSGEAHLAGW